MKLENRYQQILNDSFRKHFPGWDSASPMDPVKVFSEGLSCSLAEIERRQTRFVDTVLDTLPSLMNFSAKSAKAPVGWFQLKPNAGLSEPKTLGPENTFRFQGEKGTCQIAPVASIRLAPFHDVRFSSQGQTVEMKAAIKAPCKEIAITFLPALQPNASNHQPVKLKEVILTISHGSTRKVETFFQEELSLTDYTKEFTSPGEIVIKPGKASGLLSFGAGTADLSLKFIFDDRSPSGSFYTNLFPFHLFEVETDRCLATLKGEPWEEIPLDDRVLGTPSQIQLQYPDDHSVILNRLEMDLLKLRHTDPSRFQNAFFYNPTSHSLILPGGALLMGDYTGGVTLYAETIHLSPALDWLSPDFQGSTGDLAAFIDKIVPIQAISPFFKRETKVEFLKRFYATMRFLSANPMPSPGILKSELVSQIEGVDPSLKRVELTVDAESKEITVYLLSDVHLANPTDSHSLPTELVNKVAALLNRMIPLDYQWKMEPFTNVAVTVFIKTEVSLEEGRMGSLNDALVSQRIKEHCRDLLSPFGLKAGIPETKESFLARLRGRLSHPLSDHSHLEPSELIRVEALIVNPCTSHFGESIGRRDGEIVVPTIEVETNWQRLSEEVSENFDPALSENAAGRRSHG